jgi:hypothetical protein
MLAHMEFLYMKQYRKLSSNYLYIRFLQNHILRGGKMWYTQDNKEFISKIGVVT